MIEVAEWTSDRVFCLSDQVTRMLLLTEIEYLLMQRQDSLRKPQQKIALQIKETANLSLNPLSQ
jgi:hypothetical protein